MIFNALSGSFGQVHVTPVGAWDSNVLCFIALAKQIVALLKKHLSYIMYGILECCS